jgi:hypothetical protein
MANTVPGWRGTSAGIMGADLAYGVANPPPSGKLGQSYVTGMPTGRLPMRPLAGAVVPGVADGVPGKPVARASGNPDVSSIPYIPPPKTPYGRPRVLNVMQESSWRGGAYFADDKLIARDRHIVRKTGTELSGRDSGYTDPPMDGPARPSFDMVNLTVNYQMGTDNDIAQDDLTRPYPKNAQGMFLGEQGSGWNRVYGGTPGLYQPYGSYDGYTAGPVKGIQSPVPQGQPGDGPQSFFSGPPHGLHSPTMPDYAPTLGYYMAVPQMRLPRIDRPSNSTIGGQSYSQVVQPQGQTGTIAQQSSGQNLSSAGAGVNWQTTRRAGWRGQAGAGNAG